MERTPAKLSEAACIVVFLFVCLYVRAKKTEKNQLMINWLMLGLWWILWWHLTLTFDLECNFRIFGQGNCRQRENCWSDFDAI